MRHTELLEPYGETPIISQHARERSAEMGISTKVAKRIWRTRTLVRGMYDQPGRLIVTSTTEPDYVIVVDPTGWHGEGGRPVVITVLFASQEEYLRRGRTYEVKAVTGMAS